MYRPLAIFTSDCVDPSGRWSVTEKKNVSIVSLRQTCSHSLRKTHTQKLADLKAKSQRQFHLSAQDGSLALGKCFSG